jgi:hypothetical protein
MEIIKFILRIKITPLWGVFTKNAKTALFFLQRTNRNDIQGSNGRLPSGVEEANC